MRERIRNFLTRQFGNPSGLFGRFIGNRMAKGNVYDAQWTISLLGLRPYDRILEIGFGPGVSTELASKKVPQGFLAGIDHSKTMVQVAGHRNADAIQAGRMELKQGDVASLPFPDRSFDTAFSLHSIYFWQKPLESLKEIKRVLKPGGLLAITIQPKDEWKPNVDANVMTLYFGKDIVALFSEADFRNVRLEVSPPEDKKFLECILGVT